MKGLNYSVRLFQYDGDWIAEYPDLPGCTGVGDTPEEALASGEISKELWLEDYYEEHKAYPVSKDTYSKDYSGKFLIRISPDLHRDLAIKAEEQGVSLNSLCASYLAKRHGENTSAPNLHFVIKTNNTENIQREERWEGKKTKRINVPCSV